MAVGAAAAAVDGGALRPSLGSIVPRSARARQPRGLPESRVPDNPVP
jgi:hypothetical protein